MTQKRPDCTKPFISTMRSVSNSVSSAPSSTAQQSSVAKPKLAPAAWLVPPHLLHTPELYPPKLYQETCTLTTTQPRHQAAAS